MIDTVEKPTKRLLIDATLKLIDQHKGLRGVTLREITKNAGCKHTNLYNYFNNFEDLLWHCLAEAVMQNVNFTNERIAECHGQEQFLTVFSESQIEFALEHPGLYHFMWLEALNGTHPPSVREIIYSPFPHFAELLKKNIPSRALDNEVQNIADILHGYLHGETCKLINNRYFDNTKDEYRNYIVKNVIRIYSSLTSHP